VPVSLKYAVVERERRFLLAGLPGGVSDVREIVDRYLTGTRLRLREVRGPDGTVVRKLTQKVRLGDGPAEVACTTFYLDDAEWAALAALPGRTLHKRRHILVRDGLQVAVDEHVDGTLVAELDDGTQACDVVPGWLDVVAEVTHDEAWTGDGLAGRFSPRA
jgi:CYTH domain-containing protein